MILYCTVNPPSGAGLFSWIKYSPGVVSPSVASSTATMLTMGTSSGWGDPPSVTLILLRSLSLVTVMVEVN